MGQRSDAKLKMIKAARQLIRERGYHATALSDVLELSAAPRGSVYFHFPGGKTELAVEAVRAFAREQAGLIEHAAEGSGSAVELISSYVTRARANLVKSNYAEGCTIAPLILEGALVTARAFRSPAPFDSILVALVNHATQLGLAEPASTSRG